jgi:hypothetical protein
VRVFWDIAPCSLVEINRRFRGAYCLHHQGFFAPMTKAVRTSHASVYFNETTQRYIPEDSHLHNFEHVPNFNTCLSNMCRVTFESLRICRTWDDGQRPETVCVNSNLVIHMLLDLVVVSPDITQTGEPPVCRLPIIDY